MSVSGVAQLLIYSIMEQLIKYTYGHLINITACVYFILYFAFCIHYFIFSFLIITHIMLWKLNKLIVTKCMFLSCEHDWPFPIKTSFCLAVSHLLLFFCCMHCFACHSSSGHFSTLLKWFILLYPLYTLPHAGHCLSCHGIVIYVIYKLFF